MKPVPSVLLIAAVLSTHIPPSLCRPRDLRLLDRRDDFKSRLEMWLRAGEGEAVSHLGVGGGDSRGRATLPVPNSLEMLMGLSKRNDDPPISIDLTFHLLRNMIEMARNENQREQAELNRKYLDEIGK